MGISFGIFTQEWHIFLKAGTLIVMGIPIYFMLNIFYNPEATRKINDQFSFLSLWFENYSLPKSVREKIVNMFGDIHGKKIFEFGASIGTITLELAKAVGPTGRIEAVDLSESNIKVLKKRLIKHHHTQVRAFHDKHMINRVHPEIKEADMIFSVGSIDYIQNLQKVLKEMADILPENGKICIVEYSDFFGFIPDSGWKSNLEELEKVFERAGFKIRMIKWKGFFWNYICIYGIKTDEEIVVI
jgi:ubiquinone/menaquinone biosynthesis C-methylase UbiE